jgi:hypothetical protein
MANRDVMRQIQDQRGVDIRLPSYAMLGVSSSDRYKTNGERAFGRVSPYNFAVQSPQNFLTGFFTRLALTELKFNWTIPTITAYNDGMGIIFRVNGVGPPIAGGIVVPAGQWHTPTTLAAVVQAEVRLVNPALANFTVVADPNTGAFTAQTNTLTTFHFIPTVPDNQRPRQTTIYEMMNWIDNIVGGNDATQQFSGIPTMLPTQYVDIVCSQLSYNQDVKDADTSTVSRDLLARIYLAQDWEGNPELVGSQPFSIYRQFAFPKQIKWNSGQNLGGYLKFEVYDDAGYLLSTGLDPAYDVRMGEWNATILASEV